MVGMEDEEDYSGALYSRTPRSEEAGHQGGVELAADFNEEE